MKFYPVLSTDDRDLTWMTSRAKAMAKVRELRCLGKTTDAVLDGIDYPLNSTGILAMADDVRKIVTSNSLGDYHAEP